jgi:hypothetical protein
VSSDLPRPPAGLGTKECCSAYGKMVAGLIYRQYPLTISLVLQLQLTKHVYPCHIATVVEVPFQSANALYFDTTSLSLSQAEDHTVTGLSLYEIETLLDFFRFPD